MTPPKPQDIPHEPLFTQRLSPHRSLNARQFRVLMVIFSLMSSAATLPFFLAGAWPVIGFMGLDILLIYLAFRASFRSARAYEDIRLDMHDLHLAQVSAKGKRRDWHFNPRWVRLDYVEDEDFGIQKLNLHSSGQSVEMGRFLAPNERENFIKAFRPALHAAQRGPKFS